jgi:hypothetical protein
VHGWWLQLLDDASGRYQGIEPDAPQGVVF